MKKILIQAYLVGNLGDDLFIKILSERYPKIEFQAFCSPKDKGKYSHFANVSVVANGFLRRILEKFIVRGLIPFYHRKYAAVIEIGGSLFQQASAEEKVSKARKYWSKHLPYFVIGSNFGPIMTNSYVDQYHAFFEKISGTVFRDKHSFGFFRDIKTVRYAPDVVFNLKVPNKDGSEKRKERKTAILAPIDLTCSKRVNYDELHINRRNYEERYANIAKVLLKLGYYIKFLPFSTAEGDREAIGRIVEQIPTEKLTNVHIIEEEDSESKIAAIQGCSLLIGSRFHAMVLGWVFQKPQLVIAYNEKFNSVKQDIFPKQYFKSVQEFSNQPEYFELTSLNTLPNNILIDVRHQAERQFSFFDEYIKNSAELGRQS